MNFISLSFKGVKSANHLTTVLSADTIHTKNHEIPDKSQLYSLECSPLMHPWPLSRSNFHRIRITNGDRVCNCSFLYFRRFRTSTRSIPSDSSALSGCVFIHQATLLRNIFSLHDAVLVHKTLILHHFLDIRHAFFLRQTVLLCHIIDTRLPLTPRQPQAATPVFSSENSCRTLPWQEGFPGLELNENFGALSTNDTQMKL
jgi:hypothetical protein